MRSRFVFGCILILVASITPPAQAQEDVADVPAEDLRVGDDPQQRYFLIGADDGKAAPEEGIGLLLVLPGGDGSAEFHSFVKRIYKNAVPEGYLMAQLVAPQWSPGQRITWPTAKSKVPQQKMTTEEFIEAVIKDVASKQKLNRDRIYTLSWSSGGPAAYAASLSSPSIRGSFVAMSVFNPKHLPSLKQASGRAYYIYHSPEDRVCPFRMAQQAANDLKQNGGKTELATYEGGHGWRGNVYGNIRTGFNWLETNSSAAPATDSKPVR
ncbi:alpha/beta hydrolase [Blastopirellula marina]|nr:hypothetical protein [Blastopirellula marina]